MLKLINITNLLFKYILIIKYHCKAVGASSKLAQYNPVHIYIGTKPLTFHFGGCLYQNKINAPILLLSNSPQCVHLSNL